MANNLLKSYSKVKPESQRFFRKKNLFFLIFAVTLDMTGMIFIPIKDIQVSSIPLKFEQWHSRHWGENAKTKKKCLWPCKRYTWVFVLLKSQWSKQQLVVSSLKESRWERLVVYTQKILVNMNMGHLPWGSCPPFSAMIL